MPPAEFDQKSVVAPVAGASFAALAFTAGYLLQMTLLHLLGLAVAAFSLVGVIVRHGRLYGSFFRRWKTLSESARMRVRGQHESLSKRRSAAIVTALGAAVLIVLSVPLIVQSETIRGADLNGPGVVFLAYNRAASPHLGELIDLYVVRDLPLEQTSSTDLRILRNLYFAVEGYSFDSEDLQNLFEDLIWYKPAHSFPNDINALPDSYRLEVEAIMAVERTRG